MSALSLARLRHFLEKPAAGKRDTVRFFTRRWLSGIPYAPVPLRLELDGERLVLWWSFVPRNFHPDRGFFDYPGEDIGELRFLFSYLQAGAVFFDIGTYHGIYALVVAKRLRGQGEIVAFEPSARERRRLKLHLRMNGAEGVKVEAYALGSRHSTAVLYAPLDDNLSTWNSLRPPGVQGSVAASTVEVLSLDEYVERRGLERLDVMKVDTEGAEREVFRGAERVLGKFRPLILCEVLDQVTAPWGYPAREIVAHLRGCDYDWYDFCRDGKLFPHAPQQEYPECANHLAVPREKLSRVAPWVRPAGEGVSA